MNKQQAIEKLETLINKANELVQVPRGSQDFKKWNRDTEVAIERIFGGETRHLQDFQGVRYSLGYFSTGTPDHEFEHAYRQGVRTAITVLQSFIDEIEEYWTIKPK